MEISSPWRWESFSVRERTGRGNRQSGCPVLSRISSRTLIFAATLLFCYVTFSLGWLRQPSPSPLLPLGRHAITVKLPYNNSFVSNYQHCKQARPSWAEDTGRDWKMYSFYLSKSENGTWQGGLVFVPVFFFFFLPLVSGNTWAEKVYMTLWNVFVDKVGWIP